MDYTLLKTNPIAEEMSKKPFYVEETVLWACDGGVNEYQDPLFTRQESVLTQTRHTTKNKRKKLHHISPRNKRAYAKQSTQKMSKRFKEDLYDMNNVVFYDTRIQSINNPAVSRETHPSKIFIPEFKVMNNEFYKDIDINDILENDDEAHYTDMHRPYEIAENCNKFLDNGQGLPEELKGGLKIRIKLPSNSNELPFLI